MKKAKPLLFIAAIAVFAPCHGEDRRAENRPALVLGLFAGPALGLERFFRGGAAGLSVGVAAGRLSAALRSSIYYDASLGSPFAEAGVSLGLGEGLRLSVGGEVPLGSPALGGMGASFGGEACRLAAAAWPNRFALSVPLARVAGRDAGSGRPSLDAEAELSYSAYRILPGSGPPPAAAASGIAGFSAGFRAYVGLRLEWKPGLRNPAARAESGGAAGRAFLAAGETGNSH